MYSTVEGGETLQHLCREPGILHDVVKTYQVCRPFATLQDSSQ